MSFLLRQVYSRAHVPKVNKAVVLLATLHHDQLTADDEQKKLAIVTMYNQTKVGVCMAYVPHVDGQSSCSLHYSILHV